MSLRLIQTAKSLVVRVVDEEGRQSDNDLSALLVWAAAGSVDTNLSFSSRFKLCRADVAQRRVSPSRVVEALDVVEHV